MKGFLYYLQETALCNRTTGNFYVIDTLTTPCFVMDESGEPKRFETYEEALAEAEDYQEAYVIAL